MQRVEKQRSSLEREAKQAAQCEAYSERANLIVSNLYAIPAGADSCVVTAYNDDGSSREVFLKFNKAKFRDAKEEADWLFAKARKMRRGTKVIADLLETNEEQRIFLAESLAALSAIDDANGATLELVKQRVLSSKVVEVHFDDQCPSTNPSVDNREKQQQNQHRARRQQSPPKPEFRRFVGDESEGSLEILVGRNRRENEKLSFAVGKKGDLWLHARGVPGAHVVVRNDHSRGRRCAADIGPRTLQLAANLALFYSNHRNEARAEVSVAEPKHVLKPARAPLGTVKLRQELAVLVGSPFEVPQECVDKRAEGEKEEEPEF